METAPSAETTSGPGDTPGGTGTPGAGGPGRGPGGSGGGRAPGGGHRSVVGRYLARWWGATARRRAWWQLLYVAVTLPVATLWFVLLLTGLSLGACLAVVTVGLPILAGVFTLSGVLAEVERRRARQMLGVEVVAPPARPVQGEGWGARFRAAASDPVMWREVAYHGVAFLLSAVTFTLVVGCWYHGLWMITLPFLDAVVPGKVDVFWIGVDIATPLEWTVAPLAGALALLAAPAVTHAGATVQGALLRSMLGTSRGDLEDRARRLAAQRDRSVARAAAERREIERDLHDGAQARLVSLAVELGRARERIDEGQQIEDIERLVASAHEQTRLALAELRDLARGIHPAVLTDRGLDAAFSALAGRSPVPVTVSVRVGQRPSPTVEAAAYFLVAEALTNVVRHGRATRVTVAVERSGDELMVEVRDDGGGGAVERPGGGLAGLRERVEAMDGWFQLTSPPGGPTVVTAVLPCRR